LHCAASEGHAGVAGLLLDRGADVNIMDKVSHVDLIACDIMLCSMNDTMATGTSVCDNSYCSFSVSFESTEGIIDHCDVNDNYDCTLYGKQFLLFPSFFLFCVPLLT
jgi:Ankyrin repeat